MPQHQQHHEGHTHEHGPGCGHTAIRHEGHVDYVHDGHLHHPHGQDAVEHTIAVSDANPDRCTPEQECEDGGGAMAAHAQETVPHGDHVDHIHKGRLHHHHGDHCDDHGPVEIVEPS
ncbi:MAG TPA: hypothetical protein VF188_04895 [Longimicrobiales bacterium]